MLMNLACRSRARCEKLVDAGAIAQLVAPLARSRSNKLLELAASTLTKLAVAGGQHCVVITAAGAIPHLVCRSR